MTRLKLMLLLSMVSGCAGSGPRPDDAVVQSWLGIWRGVAIVEGTNEPSDEWVLSLTRDNSRLRGRISSKRELFTGVKIERLAVTATELRFAFSYETSRGLRAVFQCSAIREGHKLLCLLDAGEGGRAFRGRWEARYEP